MMLIEPSCRSYSLSQITLRRSFLKVTKHHGGLSTIGSLVAAPQRLRRSSGRLRNSSGEPMAGQNSDQKRLTEEGVTE